MDKQLFIPEKIKVGFQKREGTYNGKLAYVIYFDQKGVLRKEKSWESWRDKKVGSEEFANEPIDGFVLNKGVGGQRQSYGWNARNEYIRVYDARGFEFEISVANLLFILRECDCNKGKGLEGKFVYAWDGTELVLLPVSSTDYQNSKNFTKLQGQSVKVKELIAGASYTTKKQEVLIYLGRFDYYHVEKQPDAYELEYAQNRGRKIPMIGKGVCKKYVFWNGKNFVYQNEVKNIGALNSDTVSPDFAELVQKYNKSIRGSKPVKFFTKVIKKKEPKYGHEMFCRQEADGSYTECYVEFQNQYYGDTTKIVCVRESRNLSIKDGVLIHERRTGIAYPSSDHPLAAKAESRQRYANERKVAWIEPSELRLFVELESGAKFPIDTLLERVY